MIIICKGNTSTPPRFWGWHVCNEEDFTETDKEHGWVKSTCTIYLTQKQLEQLQNND